MTTTEAHRVTTSLRDRGVAGTEDFGYFVNNTKSFRASRFDERAAMPFLLELLPGLHDPNVVATVARHLRRPWARPVAFDAAYQAFVLWATDNSESDTAWALGDAVANAATATRLDEILRLATNPEFGAGRQMVVAGLYRFKAPETAEALTLLIRDSAVALHAMSALRPVLGDRHSRPLIEAVQRDNPGSRLADFAGRELKKIEKKQSR